ncbi:MAG: hypothetical protein IT529_10910 [Burkholderiales bacterium]|nr:hypothetical protein [Burkholderiales bacterium]
MNKNQKIILAIGAASLAFLVLFPPYDQYSIAHFKVPVFAGFYFHFAPPPYGQVNTSLLTLELVVVLVNAGIGWLLLQERPAAGARARRIGLQRAVLAFAAFNLVLVILFPPLESVFALTNAALPSFEGFYFIFGSRPNHTVVTTLLYLEVIFIMVNTAIAWLAFRPRAATVLTTDQARALAERLRGPAH